jgi:CRP/FNR family transcriptional regulator, cyclic AMP receptor protein
MTCPKGDAGYVEARISRFQGRNTCRIERAWIARTVAEEAMDTSDLKTLRAVPFFQFLHDASIKRLLGKCVHAHFQPGQTILGHEERTTDVLFLISGQARVNIYSAGGRRVSFRDIGQGAIFGELSAIDGQPRSATVEAVNICSAVKMPRQEFLKALEEEPEFMKATMRHLAQQVRTLTSRVFEFSTLAVRNRVQAELLRMATPSGEITPVPTHEDLASRISTHREAVTRELSRLEGMGLLTRQGRALRITDMGALRRLVDDVSEDE